MMLSKPRSIKPINKAKIKEATNTNTELLCNSDHFGQLTLCLISSTDESTNDFNLLIEFVLYFCTGGKIRTHDPWFWRPMLYQLSYTRVCIKNTSLLTRKAVFKCSLIQRLCSLTRKRALKRAANVEIFI